MPTTADWMSAREAATRLDVKLETLYAYASRGLVESVPAPSGRGRRYARASIERLKARHDARSGHGAVAAGALRWGEPSIETSISDIREDGPTYRGHRLSALCAQAESFESVVALLWCGQLGPPRFAEPPPKLPVPPRPARPSVGAHFAAAISLAALRDEARHGASEADEHARGRRLITWLATIAGGRASRLPDDASVAERLLAGHGVRSSAKHVRAVDRALILCADHELNASTFAARVTASTGADLYACLGSALHTFTGPKHGGVTQQVEALLREVKRPEHAGDVLRARLARGEAIPGFGHRLYEQGDPRATALLALAEELGKKSAARARIASVVTAMKRARQPGPNLDAGLVGLSQTLGLPEGASAALFAVGRVAGWVAHALEQRAQGYLLRPRSLYTGAMQIED